MNIAAVAKTLRTFERCRYFRLDELKETFSAIERGPDFLLPDERLVFALELTRRHHKGPTDANEFVSAKIHELWNKKLNLPGGINATY